MTASQTGRVQTVLGQVDPSALGHTQPHEHVLCDLTALIGHQPSDRATAGVDEPIRLENYQQIRRNPFSNRRNLRLASEMDAIVELDSYRSAGGGTIVDASSVGMGRNPAGLKRIATATGVHIIMGSGFYVRRSHPPSLENRPEADIAEEIIGDLTLGVGDTDVRAGVIGEIGLSWPVHPIEKRVLQAATRAQAVTGAPLQIHPGRHPDAPMNAVRIVERSGGDPQRTIISHIDRTLVALSAMLELARTGCYLEFDLFGKETSYYQLAVGDMPSDATRIDHLIQLSEAGYQKKLLVSQDVCTKVRLTRYGGEGYRHILETVIPQMLEKGLTKNDVNVLTRENPATALTLT